MASGGDGAGLRCVGKRATSQVYSDIVLAPTFLHLS